MDTIWYIYKSDTLSDFRFIGYFYILRIMISDVKKQQVRSILLFVWTVIMASLATGEFYNVDS